MSKKFNLRWLSLSKDSGITRRNDCYTKYGGFDKLNHRNANLLDSPFFLSVSNRYIFSKFNQYFSSYFLKINLS